MGAPLGNQNRALQYRIKRTLESCLEKRSKKDGLDALEAACDALIDRSLSSLQDFKQLADRLDGKPAQAIDLGSDPDRPLISKVVREIVRPPHKDG